MIVTILAHSDILLTVYLIGNSSVAPCDGEWLTGKDGSQGGEHAMTLLAHGREIAANATKSRQPILAAKGACDLLLDFRHAQIPLGLIVGKWHREVLEKGQHLLGPPQQVIE